MHTLIKTPAIAAITAVTVIFWSGRAIAISFSTIYAFGDSLTDSGNVFSASNQTFPPSPPYAGRFSNGPVWVEYLAQDLDISLEPSVDLLGTEIAPEQGINFAFGGATTANANTTDPQLPGIQGEIAQFSLGFLEGQPVADPDALYILWGGANDYLPTESPDFVPFTDPDPVVSNLSTSVSLLFGLGARNFLVANLPDLGQLPLTRPTPLSDPLDTLTADHNVLLSTTLSDLEPALPGSTLTLLDVNSIFREALVGDTAFSNVTDPCFDVSPFGLCLNPDEFLFWDNVHPTTAAHRLVADEALVSLSPEEPPVATPEPFSVAGLLAMGIAGLIVKRKL